MYMHGDLSRPFHGYYNKPPNPINIYNKEESKEDKGLLECSSEKSENDSFWEEDLELSSNSENFLSNSDGENEEINGDMEEEDDNVNDSVPEDKEEDKEDNDNTSNNTNNSNNKEYTQENREDTGDTKENREKKQYYVNKYLKFLRDESANIDVSDFGSEELEKIEMKNFYMWRSLLSEVEAREKSVVTPYEKNIDFWRQLWRVIERSHLILIILDSRDPLFFRIVDLENYIKEIDKSKEFMLVLNKADFLSKEMRIRWARYFKSKNIDYVFFSSVYNSPNNTTNKDSNYESSNNEYSDSEGISEGVSPSSDITTNSNINNEEKEKENEDNVNNTEDNNKDKNDSNNDSDAEDKENNSNNKEYTQENRDEKEEPVEGLDELDYKIFDVELLLEKINKYKEKFYINNPQYTNGTNNKENNNNKDKEEKEKDNKEEVSDKENNNNKDNKKNRNGRNRDEKKERQNNRNKREKRRGHCYTVGFVGYPNVGKSSLINCLMESTKACVGVQPGKTKHMQTLFLKKSNILLCDCPGLIFPTLVCTKYHLLINNIVSTSHFKGNMVLAVQLICNLIPLQLCKKYDININDCLLTTTSSNHSNFNNFNKHMNSIGGSSNENLDKSVLKGRKVLFSLKLLELLCRNRNYRSGGKGGQLDYNRASKLIIDDFTQGVLLYCKKPPMLDKGDYYEDYNGSYEEDEELGLGLESENLEKSGDMKNREGSRRMDNGDIGSQNMEVEFNKMYITNTSNVTEPRYIGKTVTESKKDEENVNQWLKQQLNKVRRK